MWLSRTRLEWARMLLRRGEGRDRKRAEELLDPAAATARELELVRMERQALELLRPA